MPPLEGTERAVSWGVHCRHQILAAAYTALVAEDDTSEVGCEAIEESARTISGVGRGRGTGVSTSPFPSAARPNRTCESPRIRLSTSPASADAGLQSQSHGVGIVLPRYR